MRVVVNLVGQRDVIEFVNIVSKIDEEVYLESSDKTVRVSGKSVLGALYSLEWSGNVFCVCNKDIYRKIEKFIVL